jgi:hypothetical protein
MTPLPSNEMSVLPFLSPGRRVGLRPCRRSKRETAFCRTGTVEQRSTQAMMNALAD